MKTNYFKTIFYISILASFCSCNKDKIENDTISQVNSSVNKVSAWLNKKEQTSSTENKAKIESLKNNLELNNLWLEQGRSDETIIVVPIKETLKFVNNKKNKVSNYLVLTYNKNGLQLNEFIVQSRLLNSNATTLERGVISKIAKNENVNQDYSLTYINVYDRFMFEVKYKGGKLNSMAEFEKKQGGNNNSANLTNSTNGPVANTASQCTDWYLVTTYHFEDGSSYQTSEYVGTTCGNCSIADPMNQSLVCDDGTGGSGSSPYSDQELTDIFNNYVQMESPNGVSNIAPTSTAGADLHSNVFSWYVIKAAFGSWSIIANTEYAYYKDTYYIIPTSSIENQYNITVFRTLSTSFQGTNLLVESEWVPGPNVDRVLNNNTKDAVGKSKVTGVIKHKLLASLSGLPVIGSLLAGLTLRTVNNVSNELTWNPR